MSPTFSRNICSDKPLFRFLVPLYNSKPSSFIKFVGRRWFGYIIAWVLVKNQNNRCFGKDKTESTEHRLHGHNDISAAIALLTRMKLIHGAIEVFCNWFRSSPWSPLGLLRENWMRKPNTKGRKNLGHESTNPGTSSYSMIITNYWAHSKVTDYLIRAVMRESILPSPWMEVSKTNVSTLAFTNSGYPDGRWIGTGDWPRYVACCRSPRFNLYNNLFKILRSWELEPLQFTIETMS